MDFWKSISGGDVMLWPRRQPAALPSTSLLPEQIAMLECLLHFTCGYAALAVLNTMGELILLPSINRLY